MPLSRRLRGGAIAAAVLLAIGTGALVFLWRTVRPGELVVPETLAGPDTLILLSFDLTRSDPGVAKGLARIVEKDAKRRSRRLPGWAHWLLGGGSESALPLRAAAVLPVRIVAAVDRPAGGDASGGVVVSLSTYSPRLASVLGAVPDPEVEGLPVVRPDRRGEIWTGLLANDILLSRSPSGLRALAGRLGGRTTEPGALFEAVRALPPPGGDGFGIVLNPGDRLERLAHDALAGYGVEAGQSDGTALRLLPPDLLGSGFSFDLVSAERATLEGVVLFGDERAAADGEEWVRRILPVSLRLAGVEAHLLVRRDGDRIQVSGTLDRIDRVWDRLLAPRGGAE